MRASRTPAFRAASSRQVCSSHDRPHQLSILIASFCKLRCELLHNRRRFLFCRVGFLNAPGSTKSLGKNRPLTITPNKRMGGVRAPRSPSHNCSRCESRLGCGIHGVYALYRLLRYAPAPMSAPGRSAFWPSAASTMACRKPTASCSALLVPSSFNWESKPSVSWSSKCCSPHHRHSRQN